MMFKNVIFHVIQLSCFCCFFFVGRGRKLRWIPHREWYSKWVFFPNVVSNWMLLFMQYRMKWPTQYSLRSLVSSLSWAENVSWPNIIYCVSIWKKDTSRKVAEEKGISGKRKLVYRRYPSRCPVCTLIRLSVKEKKIKRKTNWIEKEPLVLHSVRFFSSYPFFSCCHQTQTNFIHVKRILNRWFVVMFKWLHNTQSHNLMSVLTPSNNFQFFHIKWYLMYFCGLTFTFVSTHRSMCLHYCTNINYLLPMMYLLVQFCSIILK